jgi:hypothetical protein
LFSSLSSETLDAFTYIAPHSHTRQLLMSALIKVDCRTIKYRIAPSVNKPGRLPMPKKMQYFEWMLFVQMQQLSASML